MNCLFLGYNKNKTKLITFLKSKKIKVFHYNKILTKKIIKDKDLIISFGYRKIINKKILKNLNRPILNLHMSYLPFNRGAHPNFWSFIDSTKKGVTIHEISAKIDAGRIVCQKEIRFNSSNKKMTFKMTYRILFAELENLFIRNFQKILHYKYKAKKNSISKGTLHYKSELSRFRINWNMKIYKFLKNESIR